MACVFGAAASAQPNIQIAPARDNTLFESATGGISNGAGPNLFAGRTSSHGLRRALLYFPIQQDLLPGTPILSVVLVLHVNRTRSGSVPFALHRVTSDWGESTASASGSGGAGGPAGIGDATWTQRFHPSQPWLAPGGDFDPVASATQTVGGVGFYTWGPTEGLRNDVQRWVDDPATNFGWVLIGGEGQAQSAKRIDSRESSVNGPVLQVTFQSGTAVESETWSRVKGLFR